MAEEFLSEMPPLKEDTGKTPMRAFQMRLQTEVFLKLEIEAAKRGTTSYKLAALVLKKYVDRELILVKPNAANSANSVGEES